MTDKTDKTVSIIKKLTIRDVPTLVHLWMKVEAAKRKMTLGEFLVEICEHWQQTHQEHEEK